MHFCLTIGHSACIYRPPTDEPKGNAFCLWRREGMQNCIASLLDCIRLRTRKDPLGKRPSRLSVMSRPAVRKTGKRKQSDCRRRRRERKLGSSAMRRRVSLHGAARRTRGACSPTSGEKGPAGEGGGCHRSPRPLRS
jgi:hypothetical protein